MTKYIENQKFSKWISFSLFVLIILMTYFLIKTYGTSAFIGILFAGLVPLLLIFLLFLTTRLKIQIDKTGIKIKFIPFHFKQIKYDWIDIEKCEIVKYNPISEFGGWGIRYGFKRKAYNVKGNQGIQLVLKNGEQILIGTQNGAEVEKWIRQYFKPNE